METLEHLEEERNFTGGSNSGESELSRWRRFLIILFAVATFFFFLVLKLPEARIQNLILAHLRIQAQNQGFLFNAEKVRIGILLGPALKIYNAELKSIDDDKQTLKIPYVRVRPKILSLISSTKKAVISAELLNGEISGTVGAGPNMTVLDLDVDNIDLAGASILKAFLPVDFSGVIDGEVSLDYDGTAPKKSDGQIKLKVRKLELPPQSVYGFNLPKISIGESNIDIAIKQGVIAIRSFDVGKDIKSDDLVAKITGDGSMDRTLERTRINAKAVFQLSQGVMQSFPLLETILAPAKTPDGKYSYRFSGPLMGLEAHPGG